MLQRIAALLLFFTTASAFAASRPVAPAEIPHAVAMFMASLAGDGKTKVTYSATARGTHFFFAEDGGVTVYTFDGASYRRSEFLKGYTLAKAIRKYSGSEPAAPAAK